ncbi:hypothetical protein NUV25_14450 [Burkholderia pseudomultivorans]|uniref:hypothetical protein n=1 Tax=Burkholderia pseudomultivorans TaxID=1207504 RepID=UPI0028742934|nr:hypothetical protein [Burkholderia pseudomultivorans]MDS0858907.1 hypothetical protein [Burkholderia pseudomultivorans]
MSGELSGMVYDGPMTANQSIIDEIEMIIFRRKILKFFRKPPLTSRRLHRRSIQAGAHRAARGYSFFYFLIRDGNQVEYRKRLRIIVDSIDFAHF